MKFVHKAHVILFTRYTHIFWLITLFNITYTKANHANLIRLRSLLTLETRRHFPPTHISWVTKYLNLTSYFEMYNQIIQPTICMYLENSKFAKRSSFYCLI